MVESPGRDFPVEYSTRCGEGPGEDAGSVHVRRVITHLDLLTDAYEASIWQSARSFGFMGYKTDFILAPHRLAPAYESCQIEDIYHKHVVWHLQAPSYSQGEGKNSSISTCKGFYKVANHLRDQECREPVGTQ
ncbi:hypothetical protein CBL_01624 [Carabus blaptoides fortunei]